ncbi:MAG: DUF4150 domain-containing protein [Candidatus Thiodiazotropha sp. (ex Lucinoma kastoroae)]|nr:DUF4150 domain-containing protein [Candidatus Thiodiazotropha sp. (ex Lucinoma kastoroae)]
MGEKNNVFANNREIACKAAEGVTSAAFPDVCWSPPSPSAGPVRIPYTNTAYAKDTANGSSTVFISGKPVIKKDISYFKTSEGNELATDKLGQGEKTGVIKGKAYFTSWSMDVKVEGQNVARHEDYMTHNHASKPGNTGAWLYLDSSNQNDCKAAKKRVDDACDVDEDEQKKFKKQQKRANQKRKKKGKSQRKSRTKTWKDNHCKKLLVAPDQSAIKSSMDKILTEGQDMLDTLKGEVWSQAGDIAMDASVGVGERAVVKHAGGLLCGAFAPVCEAAALVVDVIDGVVTTVGSAIDMIDTAMNLADDAGAVRDAMDRAQKVKDAIGDEDKLKELKDEMLEEMNEEVKNDKCLQARKCMLVPYKKSKQEKMRKDEIGAGPTGNLSTRLGLGDSRGCCPGQTGHHLVPGSWVKNKCSPYDHDSAPVTCMEGTGHSDGSHGAMHTGMNKAYDEALSAKAAQDLDGKVNINEAMDMAVQSHQEVYPVDRAWSLVDGCETKCLKAQLKKYYDDLKCDEALDAKKIGKDAGAGDDDNGR